MSWQTLRLTESMLLLSTFCDLHILVMYIFCFVDSRNTINLSKKQRLCCVLYKLRFQSIEFNRFRLFSLWFPKHCEQLFHLKLCFYAVMQLNRALSTQSADGIVKGCLSFPWLLSDCLPGHIYLFTAHADVRLPLRLPSVTLSYLRCMRLFSLCVSFRVCFSWHLSLSFLFFPFYWVWYVLFWYFIYLAFLAFWN